MATTTKLSQGPAGARLPGHAPYCYRYARPPLFSPRVSPANSPPPHADKKALAELQGKVSKGKGPLNTGTQGIKKSGKK